MLVQIHDKYMYTHILSKYRARKSFMTKSYILNIKKKGFHYRVIYLVH